MSRGPRPPQQPTAEDSPWEEPIQSSPVQNPPGWEGGAVEHTGGNVWCRTWTRELPDHDDIQLLEVQYDLTAFDLTQDSGAVFAQEMDDNLGYRDANPPRETPTEPTDSGHTQAALRLMEKLNQNY